MPAMKHDALRIRVLVLLIVICLYVPTGSGGIVFAFTSFVSLTALSLIWPHAWTKLTETYFGLIIGAIFLHQLLVPLSQGVNSTTLSIDTTDAFRYLVYAGFYAMIYYAFKNTRSTTLANSVCMLLILYSLSGLATPLLPEGIREVYSPKALGRLIFPDSLQYEHLSILSLLYLTWRRLDFSCRSNRRDPQRENAIFPWSSVVRIMFAISVLLCFSKISLPLAMALLLLALGERLISIIAILKRKRICEKSLRRLIAFLGITILISCVLAYQAFSNPTIMTVAQTVVGTRANLTDIGSLVTGNIDTVLESRSFDHRLNEYSEIVSQGTASLFLGSGAGNYIDADLGESTLAFFLFRFGIIITLFLLIVLSRILFISYKSTSLFIKLESATILLLISSTTSPFALRLGIVFVMYIASLEITRTEVLKT